MAQPDLSTYRKVQTAPEARQLTAREMALIRAFRRHCERDQSYGLRVVAAQAESAREALDQTAQYGCPPPP